MTENEAKVRAQEVYAKDELFILLSITRANMEVGKSVPYVGMLKNGETILFLFTSYEYAKQYVDKCGYEVLDGVYTIGTVEKNHKFNNLYTIFNIAAQMGIKKVDINPLTEEAFGCNIDWFMAVNGLEKEALSVVLSEDELAKVKNNNGQVPVRMNPVDIYQYSNPYMVSPERAEVILHHVFEADPEKPFEEFEKLFLNEQTLHENCFVADYINTKMIPAAQQREKENDVQWFKMVNRVIQKTVWNRLSEQELYTLTDRQTGELYLKNNCMYVVYTDLFKYMGRLDYQKINSKEEVLQMAREHGVEMLVVTDGPHGMTLIEKPIWDGENS